MPTKKQEQLSKWVVVLVLAAASCSLFVVCMAVNLKAKLIYAGF